MLVWAKSFGFEPVMLMLEMFRVALPLLVMVTGWEALWLATRWLLKVRLVGAKLMAGALMPRPVSEMLCGLPTALSVRVIAPVRVPVAVGLKVTLMMQEAVGAKPVPQLSVSEKSPLATIVRLVTARTVLWFVSVTVCAVLEVPTGWLAKLILNVERFTVGWLMTVTVRVCVLLPGLGSGSLADTVAVSLTVPAA